jgi:hypothetical protein
LRSSAKPLPSASCKRRSQSVHGIDQLDAVNAMKAMIDGRSKALVCLGGNFSIALPDIDLSYQGMRNLDFAGQCNLLSVNAFEAIHSG